MALAMARGSHAATTHHAARCLSSSSDGVADMPPTPTAAAGFNKLLDATQRSILKEERAMLHTLHTQLLDLGTPADELQVLRDTISQMDELFMVCIVGEFNAGKSSFINALLGDKFVAEGVLPTTAQVCVLKYGEKQSVTTHVDAFGVADEDVQEMRLPVPHPHHNHTMTKPRTYYPYTRSVWNANASSTPQHRQHQYASHYHLQLSHSSSYCRCRGCPTWQWWTPLVQTP